MSMEIETRSTISKLEGAESEFEQCLQLVSSVLHEERRQEQIMNSLNLQVNYLKKENQELYFQNEKISLLVSQMKSLSSEFNIEEKEILELEEDLAGLEQKQLNSRENYEVECANIWMDRTKYEKEAEGKSARIAELDDEISKYEAQFNGIEAEIGRLLDQSLENKNAVYAENLKSLIQEKRDSIVEGQKEIEHYKLEMEEKIEMIVQSYINLQKDYKEFIHHNGMPGPSMDHRKYRSSGINPDGKVVKNDYERRLETAPCNSEFMSLKRKSADISEPFPSRREDQKRMKRK